MIDIIDKGKEKYEEKILKDIIEERFVIEGEAYVKKIADNLFVVGGNKNTNIWYFCDKTGRVFFSLKSIRKSYFITGAQIEAGYWEKKNEKGEYEMYRIKYIDLEGMLTYKPKLGEKIDKYTLEYFEAWKYIRFANHRLEIKSLFLSSEEGGKDVLNYDKNLLLNKDEYCFIPLNIIKIWSQTGAPRIRDLVKFYKQGQLIDKATLERIRDEKIEGEEREKLIAQANEKVFWEAVKIVEKIILEQIGDPRFARVNDNITKKEINSYYWYGYDKKRRKYISIKEDKDIINKIISGKIEHKPLISQKTYDLCIEKLKELEEIKKKEAKELKKLLKEGKKIIDKVVM